MQVLFHAVSQRGVAPGAARADMDQPRGAVTAAVFDFA